MQPTILHVDINSYFATLLQQENPFLRGKPLGVIKDVGRTCLIATSKEAKTFGVKTGFRLNEAKQLCPQILTVPAAFDRYLDATYRLQKIFRQISPDVYIYSLDEAFLDVTACRKHLYPNLHQLARHIQQLIKQDLGEWVTCNVGISHNRLLAKIASEISPPDSYQLIDESNKDIILSSVSFKDVCGIGHRLGKKLHRLGITVPYQIRFFSEAELLPTFGPFWSKELLRIAYGQESYNLTLIDKPLDHMKSVGRSITGYHPTNDEAEIQAVLYNLTEEIAYKARKMKLAGRHISLFLVSSDSHLNGWNSAAKNFWGDHLTLPTATNHTQEIFEVIYHRLYRNWHRTFSVIKFGVRLSLLQPEDQVPISLFTDYHRQHSLYQAIDKISNKYGLFTLKSASMLQQPTIRPEVTGFLGDGKYLGLR